MERCAEQIVTTNGFGFLQVVVALFKAVYMEFTVIACYDRCATLITRVICDNRAVRSIAGLAQIYCGTGT